MNSTTPLPHGSRGGPAAYVKIAKIHPEPQLPTKEAALTQQEKALTQSYDALKMAIRDNHEITNRVAHYLYEDTKKIVPYVAKGITNGMVKITPYIVEGVKRVARKAYEVDKAIRNRKPYLNKDRIQAINEGLQELNEWQYNYFKKPKRGVARARDVDQNKRKISALERKVNKMEKESKKRRRSEL